MRRRLRAIDGYREFALMAVAVHKFWGEAREDVKT